ncbi:ABC transporter substrate-binding protein [Mameliella alba]|nr:ABC transporter substrate-binding protein [Mameliella alba]MCA0956760.1 ABC transporter substrate-binding protein [Mameliella alba]
MTRRTLQAAALALCLGGAALADTQGVTDTEIRIGSYSDLSGPVAVWGVAAANGQRMRYDEVNAEGGIHGRKITFLVEDMQYQVPLAVRAANRLVNRDKVFAMVANVGTPHNNATMPKQLAAGVPNVFPLTAALSMFEPANPLTIGYLTSYRDQTVGGMKYLVEATGKKKVCLQTQATDFGAEVELGFDAAVRDLGLEVTAVGRHRTAETEFTGSVTSLKNSGCEILVLGTFVRDTLQMYTAVREAGWDVPVIGNMVPLIPLIAETPEMDGLYVAAPFALPDFEAARETAPAVHDWYTRYVAEFGQEPNPQAQIGYVMADLVVTALKAAGPDVTAESFMQAFNGISDYRDIFDGPNISYSKTKRSGMDSLILSQVQNGEWVVIKEELPF